MGVGPHGYSPGSVPRYTVEGIFQLYLFDYFSPSYLVNRGFAQAFLYPSPTTPYSNSPRNSARL